MLIQVWIRFWLVTSAIWRLKEYVFWDWNDWKAVSTEEGKKLAEKFGIPFAETSAQTNTNVDEAFMSLAEAVVKRKTEEAGALDYKAEKSETVKISSSDKKEGKKGGCCK